VTHRLKYVVFGFVEVIQLWLKTGLVLLRESLDLGARGGLEVPSFLERLGDGLGVRWAAAWTKSVISSVRTFGMLTKRFLHFTEWALWVTISLYFSQNSSLEGDVLKFLQCDIIILEEAPVADIYVGNSSILKVSESQTIQMLPCEADVAPNLVPPLLVAESRAEEERLPCEPRADPRLDNQRELILCL
jgi:hypothetical protein